MKPLTISALFTNYQKEIQIFLNKRTNCKHTAEDLTQEVYLSLMKKQISPQNNILNIRAYLYKTAKNIAINHQIAEQRRKILWQAANEPREINNTITPERVIGDTQKLHMLNNALAELPPLTQQIFTLTRINGMKQKDVAEKLGIHITTVEKNLSKAVRHCYASVIDMNIEK
ncbi:MAG: sigma-70 family RNA polymerase sigma factor [Colwellia sp.]|nr:sigma-70 family RNA polymerase sigma factor [Colwellia sp.]